MLKIYGAELSSPANKVRFVANYLNLEYEYIQVKIREGEHRKEEFLKLNPAGKIPVIDDDGFILFESNAICKYLCYKTESELYPQDKIERVVVDQWIDFVTLHVGMAMNRVAFNRLFAPRIGVAIDENSLSEGLKFLNRFLPVVDKQLDGRQFMCTEKISLADIALLSVLDPCELSQVDLTKHPNIHNLRNRLKQEDFYTQCYKEYGQTLKKLER